ncbi:MAG: hypothetical protein HFG89_11055 [Dorea sp.]|jgi:hypothetical protein|nr:hypothetical protein [Dorea sp.]
MREIIYSEELNVSGSLIEVMFLQKPYETERTEFELSGLRAEELEMMTGKERREVMRNAGLNPDEYDF